ncbi:MAG: hypothetical protein LIO90_08050 [Bacteroidales bacterium]|nr:hypothetical protein [Bacteroidales bacterium]
MIDKVINDHGGLYNRVTTRIHLHQFTLNECERYAEALALHWSRRQIAEAYMILGGVPYYWSLFDRSLSLGQNVDALLFEEGGELRNEYRQLYASLFRNPEPYISIVEALATSQQGMTRDQLLTKASLSDNGKMSKMLQDLQFCGFIRKYCHLSQKKKDALYQLVDNYTLFYHFWVKNEPQPSRGFWSSLIGRPRYNTWCGLAFERLCFRHIEQIKCALGIQGIITNIRSWHVGKSAEKKGTQIDLLIDRSDGVVTVCEIKYSLSPYVVTEAYRETLLNKIERLSEAFNQSKSVQLVMVSASGVETNKNTDILQRTIPLDALFIES